MPIKKNKQFVRSVLKILTLKLKQNLYALHVHRVGLHQKVVLAVLLVVPVLTVRIPMTVGEEYKVFGKK